MISPVTPPPDAILAGLDQVLAAVIPGHPMAAVILPVGEPVSGADPAPALLAADELATLRSFTLPKRREQWRAGRICAKQAIARYLQRHFPALPCPDARDIRIGNRPSGRPFIDTANPALAGLDLSISHSGGFAAALVSATACGIDIQEDAPALERVSERFCRGEERDLLPCLPGSGAMQRLNLIWTAKEAARKAARDARMPGFLELALAAPAITAAGWLLWAARDAGGGRPGPATTIITTHFDIYALSIALETGENSHA